MQACKQHVSLSKTCRDLIANINVMLSNLERCLRLIMVWQVLPIGQFRRSKSTLLSYMPILSLALDAMCGCCFIPSIVKVHG